MNEDQEIRAAALQAAAAVIGNLHAGMSKDSDNAHHEASRRIMFMAAKFHAYIKYGEPSS